MRDLKRIKPFCDKLAQIWEDYVPDWRFGQLMSNFLGFVAGKKGDIWFAEEDEMSELLDEYFGSIGCVRPIKENPVDINDAVDDEDLDDDDDGDF